MRVAPKRVLDLGCGAGGDLGRLRERFPKAVRVGVDGDIGALARGASVAGDAAVRANNYSPLRKWFGRREKGACFVAAEAGRLPFADGSVALVWSNLLLPAIAEPAALFAEILRVLAPGGLFIFSTLGPDTLHEMRAIAAARAPRFVDMHDLGDALWHAGFSDPVLDMEMLTLTYSTFDALRADLDALGLGERGDWAAARDEYETLRRDGRLPATLEIVQGHAWKAETGARPRSHPNQLPDGRAVVEFHPRHHAD
jgi:malonyl-CoA O-methyltransferase